MDQKRPLTFTTFMLRLFSGIVGGAAGTLALFIVYFLMSSLVPPSDAEGPSSLAMFVVIIMAFVGTLVANTVTGVMVTFMDNTKYSRRKTTLIHIFLFNLILFFVTIPLYLIGSTLDIVNGVAAVHFLLSAFITALIMEVIAGYEYSLLGIYSTALGMFVSIAIALAMMAAGVKPISIMFAAMPGVWFILQIVSGFTELIYDNYVKLYGTDFLNIQTDLGGDKEIEKEEEGEEGEEEEKDEK
jgi:MFS family permease